MRVTTTAATRNAGPSGATEVAADVWDWVALGMCELGPRECTCVPSVLCRLDFSRSLLLNLLEVPCTTWAVEEPLGNLELDIDARALTEGDAVLECVSVVRSRDAAGRQARRHSREVLLCGVSCCRCVAARVTGHDRAERRTWK